MKIIIPWNGIGINKKLLYRIAYNMCDAKIVWNHLHNPVAPPFPWKYQACNNKAYNYKEQEKACEPQKPLFLNKKVLSYKAPYNMDNRSKHKQYSAPPVHVSDEPAAINNIIDMLDALIGIFKLRLIKHGHK